MVERVGFALEETSNMDEFYLPEETLEWLGLKKSDYLSKLIQNSTAGDFDFHEYSQFEDLIPSTLATPDWSHDTKEDGYKIKTFIRTYSQKVVFQQVVIGALIPDQQNNDVFVPILVFVTKKEQLVQLFAPMPQGLKH